MVVKLSPADYLNGNDLQIDAFGDSLTQGAGGTPFVTQLQGLLYPRLINNHGIGGQTMDQIAVRQGSKPVYISLAGGTFSGTNEIAISTISTQFLSTAADTVDRYMSGLINGIPCQIRRSVVSSIETYSIKPGGSSNEAVVNNSRFYPDFASNARQSIQILWIGRNNMPNLTGLDSLIDDCIDFVKEPRKFVVIGVLNAVTEIQNTSYYNAMKAMNDILRANYPNNYIESTPPTAAEMLAMNYTPSAQDLIEIGNKTIPTGMRADNVHLNTIGYRLIANRVFSMFKKYGW